MLSLQFVSHADSLNRLIIVLEEFGAKHTTPQEVSIVLSMGDNSVRHYVTFARDLGYMSFEREAGYSLTEKGKGLIQGTTTEKAAILFEDINALNEIKHIKSNKDGVVISLLEDKGITESSIDRYMSTLKSLTHQASSVNTVVDALNGELSRSGYSSAKRTSIPVHTWNCVCGMVNAPAISECEMCGEDKPEVVQTAAA